MTKKKTQKRPEEGTLLSGTELLIQALVDAGVDTVFGYPGGTVIGIYDALFDHPEIRHILVRHEQGATHAADGYARSTGRTGVVLVTSGPGATNTVTGIATAFMDSVPLVVITGQVPSAMIGNDAFQEADIIGITRPITKHSYLVKDVRQLGQIVNEAFHIAATGKPGPVLIDLPKDIQLEKAPYQKPGPVSIRGYNPTYKGHSQQIIKAARMIDQAQKPLIYAGGGVNSEPAAVSLTELAVKARIPVTTTLMGLGSFPESNPLSLGMLGMHGTWYANKAVTESDLIIAVGARFDDRVTGKLSAFARGAKIIHIDIDPASIAKNVPAHIPIVGHAAEILPELTLAVGRPYTQGWLEQIQKWKQEHPLQYDKDCCRIPPPFVIQKVAEVTDHRAVIVADVGQNQMFAAQWYGYEEARTHLSSGGLGTMGYGFPAAIGAKLGNPDKTVVCVVGDGGFQMNVQELATAMKYGVPVKIVLLNNGFLGMVRQWQHLFFKKRYSQTILSDANPDFVRLAESYGAIGYRVEKKDDVLPVLRKSLEVEDRPVLMEFIIEPESQVFPMVPAGAALNEMIETNPEPTA
ncbi:MAG TPA: biosynthetic-type acetolactate synthase large subunit [bacterium]|nr:biosynthetic-type acetolactate synthase large subunit [bacterium]